MTWFLRSVLFCRTGVPYAYNGPADRHVCYTMALRTDTKIDTASLQIKWIVQGKVPPERPILSYRCAVR